MDGKEASSRKVNEQVIAVGPLRHHLDHVSEPAHVKGKYAVNSWGSLVEGVS